MTLHFSLIHFPQVFIPKSFFCPNPHGQRSLIGCSLWGHKESDTVERLTLHYYNFSKRFFFPKSSFSHSTYFFLWSNDIHVPWYGLPQSILFFIYSAIVSFFIFSSLKKMKSIGIISSIFSFFCCSIVGWLSSET